jgi:anhydro-N-acetylmuramic acid kinase
VIAVGLMSGTSLDGVDAALVDIRPREQTYDVSLRRFLTQPFETSLQHALWSAMPPNPGSVAQVAHLHQRLGEAFAAAALAVTNGEPVDYVASHGQTLWYDAEQRFTLQLGDAFIIRERLDATVCYDFRSADCAVGGTGAPLVPYVDALLLRSDREDRVALNLGGIANITALPAGSSEVVAFDTGPGNMLVDALVRERTNGAQQYDRDGQMAARGKVHGALLKRMLADPYFARTPPKATGRERFGAQFLRAHAAIDALEAPDALATLVELTAVSIADAIDRLQFERPRVIVSGGGAKNRMLMQRLSARLRNACVERSDAMGLPADAKEAIAFAVLGYETLRERAANVPRATGARRAVPLGAIAPHDLKRLLAAVGRECSS